MHRRIWWHEFIGKKSTCCTYFLDSKHHKSSQGLLSSVLASCLYYFILFSLLYGLCIFPGHACMGGSHRKMRRLPWGYWALVLTVAMWRIHHNWDLKSESVPPVHTHSPKAHFKNLWHFTGPGNPVDNNTYWSLAVFEALTCAYPDLFQKLFKRQLNLVSTMFCSRSVLCLWLCSSKNKLKKDNAVGKKHIPN